MEKYLQIQIKHFVNQWNKILWYLKINPNEFSKNNRYIMLNQTTAVLSYYYLKMNFISNKQMWLNDFDITTFKMPANKSNIILMSMTAHASEFVSNKPNFGKPESLSIRMTKKI